MTPTLHNGDVFANTTKKTAILQCVVIQIFKVAFRPKRQNVWENSNFDFFFAQPQ